MLRRSPRQGVAGAEEEALGGGEGVQVVEAGAQGGGVVGDDVGDAAVHEWGQVVGVVDGPGVDLDVACGGG